MHDRRISHSLSETSATERDDGLPRGADGGCENVKDPEPDASKAIDTAMGGRHPVGDACAQVHQHVGGIVQIDPASVTEVETVTRCAAPAPAFYPQPQCRD